MGNSYLLLVPARAEMRRAYQSSVTRPIQRLVIDKHFNAGRDGVTYALSKAKEMDSIGGHCT
jgi:hypothetical protein